MKNESRCCTHHPLTPVLKEPLNDHKTYELQALGRNSLTATACTSFVRCFAACKQPFTTALNEQLLATKHSVHNEQFLQLTTVTQLPRYTPVSALARQQWTCAHSKAKQAVCSHVVPPQCMPTVSKRHTLCTHVART